MKIINFFRKKKTIAEMTAQEITDHVDALCERVKEICKPNPEPMEFLHRWKGKF